jgi:hypothetical protein
MKRKTTIEDLIVLWEKLENDDGLEGLISHLEDRVEDWEVGMDGMIEGEEEEYFSYLEEEVHSSEVVIIQTIDEMKKRTPELQKILDRLGKVQALEFILGIDEESYREDIDFPTGEGNQF